MTQNTKPELVVPAGSLEKLKYAFAYGADAVYAGIPQFSLRTRENAFTDDNIYEGIAYTHGLNKKFYLTANIIAHNRKIKPFYNKLQKMIAAGPDAVIMADPGLISMVRQKYPGCPIHLSVQANVMNKETALFWKNQGITRIILSRELSIDEIREIKDAVPNMEIEVFVHGAVCIAHSGRCLLSNFLSYRDANDGCCNNACRWSYRVSGQNANSPLPEEAHYTPLKGDFFLEETQRPGELMPIDEDEHGTYIMNAKDLMAIEYINDLLTAGVDSLKIEGRTKSIYYLSMTTRVYKKAIDDLLSGRGLDPDAVNELKKIHHRGYTAGFLINRADHHLQRYDEGVTNIYTQEFGGIVKKTRKGEILITPRNKLVIGDTIEIITPQKNYHTTIRSLTLDDGTPLEAIHGGTNIEAWIPFEEAISPEFAVISRVVPK
ncbi:MAG: tRNA 5-hydroxyuridine modification protein YegQ [Deltaproteobacteria bacterium]|nr:tRNA 5-hydroxyuridine modification protein YegQ [Deltaproteobacteria bacterium]